MKIYQLIYCTFIVSSFFIKIELNGHGFAQGSLIKSSKNGWWLIEQLCELSRKYNKPNIASYDLHSYSLINQRVKIGAESEAMFHFRIGFDNERHHDVICTPTQEFYIPLSNKWIPAYKLNIGDALLNQHSTLIKITFIEFIEKPIKVYSLEVKKTHNFFVGYYCILTHNMFLPITLSAGISGCFGSGAAIGCTAGSFFGPITFAGGIVIGGLIGIAIKMFSKNKHLPHYQLSFDNNMINEYLKNYNKQNDTNNDAQAPGKPTENDGFFPPKKWDGKKVTHPKTGGVGWPDNKGHVWVPTGHGPKAHGGPHWDRQHPNGRDYENVYPGGKIR